MFENFLLYDLIIYLYLFKKGFYSPNSNRNASKYFTPRFISWLHSTSSFTRYLYCVCITIIIFLAAFLLFEIDSSFTKRTENELTYMIGMSNLLILVRNKMMMKKISKFKFIKKPTVKLILLGQDI